MAATDYIIVEGVFNAFLTNKKKIKPGSHLMSEDRRPITDSEAIGLFEFYLRKYCVEHNTDILLITDSDGKKIFTATLIDTEGE